MTTDRSTRSSLEQNLRQHERFHEMIEEVDLPLLQAPTAFLSR